MRILHAERSPIVRLGTKLVLLGIDKDLTFFEADNYSKTIRLLEGSEYDLLLLDGLIPGGEGFKMLPRIKNIQKVQVLVFCDLSESTFGAHYLMAGADGFLQKSAAFDELVSAFSTALAGQKYVSDNVRTVLLNSIYGAFSLNENPLTVLSAKELMIADMLAKGKMIKEIAGVLRLAQSTVSFHKAQVYKKIGVQTPVELYQMMEKYA